MESKQIPESARAGAQEAEHQASSAKSIIIGAGAAFLGTLAVTYYMKRNGSDSEEKGAAR